MIDISEYKEYCVENEELILLLKNNDSIVYDRLRDFFKVLGYIDMILDAYGDIEEEFETFYEVGFAFLYSQFEEIKIIYNVYFKKDYQNFRKYESIINYQLFINDYKETLTGEELLTPSIASALDGISEETNTILENQLPFDDETFNRFNAIIASQVRIKRRILTLTETFERIVEELNL